MAIEYRSMSKVAPLLCPAGPASLLPATGMHQMHATLGQMRRQNDFIAVVGWGKSELLLQCGVSALVCSPAPCISQDTPLKASTWGVIFKPDAHAVATYRSHSFSALLDLPDPWRAADSFRPDGSNKLLSPPLQPSWWRESQLSARLFLACWQCMPHGGVAQFKPILIRKVPEASRASGPARTAMPWRLMAAMMPLACPLEAMAEADSCSDAWSLTLKPAANRPPEAVRCVRRCHTSSVECGTSSGLLE